MGIAGWVRLSLVDLVDLVDLEGLETVFLFVFFLEGLGNFGRRRL
jgi:hypothetical protein